MTENLSGPRSNDQKTEMPDSKLILPKPFDNVTRRGVRKDPKGFVTTFLGIKADTCEVIETEQLTMKTHIADSFILATIDGKQAIVHCEFQTRDSRDIPMPFRMAGYIGNCLAAYKLPIYSHAIYLDKEAGKNDPGQYVQKIADYNIQIQYRVIRLWDMDGQKLLDANRVELVPFAALTEPPAQVDGPTWLRRCVEVIETNSTDESQKRETLAAFAILGGLIYNSETIWKAVLEATVQESSIIQDLSKKWIEQGSNKGKNRVSNRVDSRVSNRVSNRVDNKGLEQGRQQGLEQGLEQGQKLQAREAILTVLTARFQVDAAEMLKPLIEAIDDLEYLNQLHLAAAKADSIEDFKSALFNINTRV